MQADLDAAESRRPGARRIYIYEQEGSRHRPIFLKKPPAGVDDITAVILILLQNKPKDKSWNAATKMMSNVDKFMEIG